MVGHREPPAPALAEHSDGRERHGADQHRLLLPQRVKCSYQITHQMQQCISFDRLGLIRLAVSTEARCNDMAARLGQGSKLIPPDIPELWEAVAEEDQGGRFLARRGGCVGHWLRQIDGIRRLPLHGKRSVRIPETTPLVEKHE